MAWQNLILLEQILLVESSQMLGLKNEKTTGLIWLKLSDLNENLNAWNGENISFLMFVTFAKNGIPDTKMIVLMPILSKIRCVTNCYSLKIR